METITLIITVKTRVRQGLAQVFSMISGEATFITPAAQAKIGGKLF
jgi:hypothetical protein